MKATSRRLWEVESEKRDGTTRNENLGVLAETAELATQKAQKWLNKNAAGYAVSKVESQGTIDIF